VLDDSGFAPSSGTPAAEEDANMRRLVEVLSLITLVAGCGAAGDGSTTSLPVATQPTTAASALSDQEQADQIGRAHV
jgi:hypothetical protein